MAKLRAVPVIPTFLRVAEAEPKLARYSLSAASGSIMTSVALISRKLPMLMTISSALNCQLPGAPTFISKTFMFRSKLPDRFLTEMPKALPAVIEAVPTLRVMPTLRSPDMPKLKFEKAMEGSLKLKGPSFLFAVPVGIVAGVPEVVPPVVVPPVVPPGVPEVEEDCVSKSKPSISKDFIWNPWVWLISKEALPPREMTSSPSTMSPSLACCMSMSRALPALVMSTEPLRLKRLATVKVAFPLKALRLPSGALNPMVFVIPPICMLSLTAPPVVLTRIFMFSAAKSRPGIPLKDIFPEASRA